ncbi:MAG: hypothetical protein JOZ77_10550 [Candidatus Eremiobacteraeota bacterium]|nr:hypothetical protein [Candidatus Eremiobacteraeota bacterium]
MGVWGAGIYSDDTATDVRDQYRDYLAEGLDGIAATDKLLVLFKDSQDDADDGPPFWLSLATTQFRYGRLEDRVRDRALKIIDGGSDMARFERNGKLKRARSQVLQRLRAQLVGPQRQAAKVRRDIPSECDWEPGEVVGFKRNSGEWIALHVQGIGEQRRSRYPIVCVLDAPFEQIEQADQHTPVLRTLVIPRRYCRVPDKDNFGPHPFFTIFGLKKRDLTSERVRRPGKKIAPKITVEGHGIPPLTPCTAWKYLDNFCDEDLERNHKLPDQHDATND